MDASTRRFPLRTASRSRGPLSASVSNTVIGNRLRPIVLGGQACPRYALRSTRVDCRAVSQPPRSPKEARRLERLKNGSRAARDVRSPKSSAARQRVQPPPPVLGSIGATSDEPTVVLSKRAVDRLAQGHVWIYRSDIAAPGTLSGGEVVRLADERGWFAGKAFYGSKSQIAVRLLTREDEPVDEDFFVRRLSQAIGMRDTVRPDPERRRATRLVHGEADLLPGLIVDRYADCLSIQT